MGYWSESEGRKVNNGGLDGRCSRSVEKVRLLQDCRRTLEAEGETCHTRAKGRQPIHQRALRLQSQAGIEDCEGTSDEEAQNAGELMLSPALSLSGSRIRAFGLGGRSHQAKVMLCTFVSYTELYWRSNGVLS